MEHSSRIPSSENPRSWLIGHFAVDIVPTHIDPEYLYYPDQYEFSERQLSSLADTLLREEVMTAIRHLAYCANIASFGSFETGDATLYINGSRTQSGSIVSNLWAARQHAIARAWPPVASVPLWDVVRWALSMRLPHRVGDTPLSRAYNAWTYLFRRPGHDDSLDLLWALVGVEALYNDSPEGAMSQLAQRTQLILGRRSSFKKELKEMYATRSRFVHGSLPFSAQEFLYDGAAEHIAYLEEMSGASRVAQAILAATLQQMVLHSWQALTFETRAVGVPVDASASGKAT